MLTRKTIKIIALILYVISLDAQVVEVDGKLIVTEMDTFNNEDLLVVKQASGLLGTRQVASLPVQLDTGRTLQTDLLLSSTLCNCSNLPPALIQSLLDNGYSVDDLVGFQVPESNLLDAGLSFQDLLDAGVSFQDLLDAGFSLQDLLDAGFSLQDLLDAGLSIQDLLDADGAPIDLFNLGISLDSLYGKYYQGGLIFYLNTSNGSGLISAAVDQGLTVWGCGEMTITGADGADIGTGSQNTTDILLDCTEAGIAADTCNNLVLNGYSDWFLPSRYELEEMHDRIGPGAPAPNTNIGSFLEEIYWTSTEIDDGSYSPEAYAYNFEIDKSEKENKSYLYYVRAIRAF